MWAIEPKAQMQQDADVIREASRCAKGLVAMLSSPNAGVTFGG
jgi:hypothetical protein